MTVSEIIKSLGGPTSVARAISVRPQAVSLWAINEQIPLERVPQLLQLARERGLPWRASDLRSDYDWQAVCCG